MRLLIIEDEILVAEDLADTLRDIDPNVDIVAIIPSVAQAIAFLNKNTVDLIFSDIQLQDGQSFDIYKQVQIPTPIVFCTAYNEFALEAIKNNGIDYITKPFSTEAIRFSLEKYKDLKRNFSDNISQTNKIEALLAQIAHKPTVTALLVYQKDHIIPIKLTEIALFYIRHDMVFLTTFMGKTYTTEKTLDQLEVLCGNTFFRVNRQQLVQRLAIVDTVQYHNRKLKLTLSVATEDSVLVSKNRVPLYLDWLVRT